MDKGPGDLAASPVGTMSLVPSIITQHLSLLSPPQPLSHRENRTVENGAENLCKGTV